MELEQENKENKKETQRCRQLTQRILRELAPGSVQVAGGRGVLAQELERSGAVLTDAAPELLVMEDPAWEPLPETLGQQVLLVCGEETAFASCAAQLAQKGYVRDFDWKDRARGQLTALFCKGEPLPPEDQLVCYEKELDGLRERLWNAEHTAQEQSAQLERLRSDLSLSRSHEQSLEKTLNGVVNSTFWKLSWPLRYLVSKCRQLWHTFPLFVFFATLRRVGIAGVRAQAKARREYGRLFPGKVMRADRFATPELLVKQAAAQPAGPKISIVVPLYNTPQQFLVELLDSVQNQTYQNWELCMVDAGQQEEVGRTVLERAASDSRIRYKKLDRNEGIAGNTNQGFAFATGDYIALLDHDDILHPCALWYVADAIVKQGADFVYTDEVTFEGDIDHLTVYHFKPDYMLDNLRSNNYICHLSVFSAALLAKVGGDERAEFNGSQDYDLYLRLTEQAQKVVHIPHILYYWRSSPTSVASNISAKMYCLESAMKALRAHYQRVGVPVDDVSMIPDTPGFYKTDYTITKPGRVSILIPSCDHASDLRTCVESIYRRSTYPDFEIIIIENNSKEPATFRYYDQLQKEHPENLKVLYWQGTGFNYSALNNFGAKAATGEYLLLLNNDTEVIAPRWMEEMVMYAQQDRVGCVGAKLLYPDNTIQHAGIGFGFLTLAAHMHKNFPVGHPGYMGRLVYAQDVYAVTAACLMVRKAVYEQVGGLDESFAVAFNDVDFCVRVREAGYTNVFTPFAQLYHYESKSRGLDEDPVKRKRFESEVKRFQQRWAKQLAAGDPCMNPNFDRMKEDFSFDIQPLE
ncbi:MAG: glycosyltransferase family 2 protein [Faecalibacterium prausnitzii]|nr:glycosyltransferase family 2 protein [Faecalibacterium prausnitzii]